MRRILPLVLLVAAVAVALGVLLGPEEPGDVGAPLDRVEATEGRPDLRSEGASAPGTESGMDTSEGSRDSARPSADVVRGRVSDEQDRPLPFAAVELTTLDPQALKGLLATPGGRLVAVVADRDGHFEAPLPESRWVRVTAAAPTYATVGRPVPGPGAFVHLRLPRAGRLEVQVVDAEGGAAVGANVTVEARGAVVAKPTDEAGQAVFETMAPGRASVRARLGARAAVASPVHVKANGVGHALVVLPAVVEVQGRVIDAVTELPVQGAEVALARPGWTAAADPTREDGSFGPLAGGGAGETVRVAVRATGYAPRLDTVVLPHADTPHEIEIRLEVAPDVHGLIVDAAGRPVAGASVGYTADGIAGRAPATTTSNASGRFTLAPPPPPAPGRRMLLVATGTQGSAALSLRPGTPPPEGVRLVLSRGVGVSGRIHASGGTPVAGAMVRLDPRWRELGDRRAPTPATARLLASSERGRLDLTASTDSEGRWRLDDVPDGVFTVRVLHAAGTTFGREAVVVAGRDVEVGTIALGTGLTLEGTVEDDTGRPLAGVEVRIRRESHTLVTVSDARGLWRVSDLEAGSWTLAAALPDHLSAYETLEVPADGPVALRLGSGTHFTGRVLDGGVRPWRFPFTVALETTSGRRTIRRRETFHASDGRFEVHGLATGSWRVRVETPRGRLADLEAPLDLMPGTTYDVEIRLTPDAVLTGRLLRPDGTPVVGGRLTLTQDDGRRTRTVTPAANGTYRVEGLLPGRWRIVARGVGGAPVETWLELPAGVPTERDIQLGPAAHVSVRVLGDDGRVRAGAYVTVRPLRGPAPVWPSPPRTDAAGRVGLRDVPEGTVEIRARTPEGEVGRATATVLVGVDAEIEVRVLPRVEADGER